MVAVLTTIGDNVAAADALTATGSADLVSAATNTSGIIITSVSITVNEAASAATTMELKVNGVTVLVCRTRGDVTTYAEQNMGGFCAIRVPAGQAVSYTFTEGSAAEGWVRITWRAG